MDANVKQTGQKIRFSQGDKEKIIREHRANKKIRSRSHKASRDYVFRALRALGSLCLMVSSVEEMQTTVDRAYPDRRQRRIVITLNSLLKFTSRKDCKLEMHQPEPFDVNFITLEDLDELLPSLPSEPWRLMVQMAFYTGMRIGELFALETRHRRKYSISVERQIDRDGFKRLPKNNKVRTVAPFAAAMHIFDAWVNNSHAISSADRGKASKIMQVAAAKTWPQKHRNIRFHDLRHSFAIAALERGASMEQIAKQLGNATEITERHYLGFVQSTRMEEAMFKLLNSQ